MVASAKEEGKLRGRKAPAAAEAAPSAGRGESAKGAAGAKAAKAPGRTATGAATSELQADGSGPARARGRSKQPDLKKDLRDFASGRPHGWDHDDWLSFLEGLQSRGHDIRNREAIGLALEKERLDLALSGVKGLGPQKRAALIEKYGTVWALRHADVEDIARAGGITSALAERIKAEVS